jgi:hypothetical protein
MAFVTVDDAIREVAQNMSLVNGSGMAPYSDTLIVSLLQQAHHFIVHEQVWSDNILTYNRVLDGTTGRITVGVPSTEVSDPRDVFRVYHESSSKPLPRVSGYLNSIVNTARFGWERIARAQDPGPQKMLIQFYPLTLTGSVQFKAHASYDFSDRDLEIPISFWAHVWRASWQYAVNDGTNPAQIDSFKNNYNESLALAKDAENDAPTQLDPFAIQPDQWYESDDPYWRG